MCFFSALPFLALQKRLGDKHLEDDSVPSERLEIRHKDLPSKFRKQSSLDFLQRCVAKNVLAGRKHSVGPLLPLQQYMIPLVLYEISFLAMGPEGSGKTSGYLLPLVNKLVEFKEIESSDFGLLFKARGRRGPLALIITYTESKLKHIKNLCSSFCAGTPLTKLFMTEEDVDVMTPSPNTVIDLLCATPRTMINVVQKFQISPKHLKFAVVEEFHYCTRDSDYKEDLIALTGLLNKNVSPAYMFISLLISPQKLFDKNFMKEVARCKLVKLIAPPGVDDIKILTIPCRSTWCHFEWTLSFLAGDGVAPRKTVVLANDPWVVHTLTLRLTLNDVPSIYLTHKDSLLEAEEAIRLWRTEECRVIVADYKSLSELDYGFVETCILFELPNDDFCSYQKRIVELSAKLNHRRRIIIMVNLELDLKNTSAVINFMKDFKQPYPNFLEVMEKNYIVTRSSGYA
ncbi:hypothetical protein NECAME_09977 [Necator americanus]|uniref:ATP-dependent RNA helicase n=1 Tax=Necator americanus TaxID=51031 RepID=W2TDA5_NECAM|nr:hypothetical protein NECAME_09977 [Necator americanus]ETN79171.1 hypothetical protein NECAME_09977 [Necator americanus]